MPQGLIGSSSLLTHLMDGVKSPGTPRPEKMLTWLLLHRRADSCWLLMQPEPGRRKQRRQAGAGASRWCRPIITAVGRLRVQDGASLGYLA